MTETPRLIDRQGAAQLWGVSIATIERWEKEGRLRRSRHAKPRHVFYDLADIEALLTSEEERDSAASVCRDQHDQG